MNDKKPKIRILMVDDEKEFLDSIIPALERRGIIVRRASDGEKALELIVGGEFDAVVLDLKMPVLDGARALKRIRQLRPDLPVVMLTAYGTIKSAIETSADGIADFIAKPCKVDALAEKLHYLTSRDNPPQSDEPDEKP